MRFIPFILAMLTATSCAQQSTSPWQGEWGDNSPSLGRLTLSACDQQGCTFRLSHGGCGTSSAPQLHLVSPTEATADIPDQDGKLSCHLALRRSSSAEPTIDIKQSGTGCSYYCIPGGTGFDTQVTQRSRTPYAGSHSEECMRGAGPARMATCHDASLADLESNWESLYPDFPLIPVAKDSKDQDRTTEVDDAIIAKCNAAPDPAACLRSRLTSDIALMNAKQAAFTAGYTDRGDPTEGGRLARAIAGSYRHTFENGDVQGHHYRSTDTLTIWPVGKASISFDTELAFYNGHSCSISGGALYRKDGSFVFDDDPADTVPGDSVCHLAIIPSAKGVTFKDLTGSCKMVYCGARGSLDGGGFTFRDRVAPKAPATPNKPPAK